MFAAVSCPGAWFVHLSMETLPCSSSLFFPIRPPAASFHSCPAEFRHVGRFAILRTYAISHGASSKRMRTHRPTTVSAPRDRDLCAVLELASDAELNELSSILYGKSLLSPVLKSIIRGDGSNRTSELENEGRDAFVRQLESRFLYLAADARETLRGWRPTYRDVLLCVRKKLNVRCSANLSTEDLEAEIFLHLLQQNTSGPSLTSPWKHQLVYSTEKVNHLSQYSESWQMALKLGGGEALKMILKGGSAFTVSSFRKLVARVMCGRILVETARYQVAKEVLKKGGQTAALNLRTRVAVLAARQGLAGAASCYATLLRTSMLLEPLMWGTLLAEVVIKSVGTDYSRVVQAIYAFAQIRLLRTYGWTQSEESGKRH